MKDRLHITAPDKRKHRGELFDLTGKVFSCHGYWNWLRFCRAGYFDRSHYDWEASRAAFLDGKLVSHYGIWDFQMRAGRGRLRTGGVGAVATHGDYLRRGFMAKTARACVNGLRGLGYDMSLLFGISNFYNKFGYVRAFSFSTVMVWADDLPKEKPRPAPRKFVFKHRPDLEALYNRENAGLTGTAVRPAYMNVNPMCAGDGYLWRGANKKPAGYVFVRPDRDKLIVNEVCGDVEQALRVLAVLARKHRCRELHFNRLHEESALARRLKWGDCRVETQHIRAGGAMIRTVNLASVLKKMESEFSRLLKKSPMAGWKGQLLISDPREKVLLTINRAKVTAGPPAKTKNRIAGGEEIAQMLIGTDDPRETAAVHKTRVQGEARLLLPVLFPCRHPMLAAWDGF